MSINKKALIAGIAAVMVATSAHADNGSYKGFQAGDILVRGRALSVTPYVTSSVSNIGGDIRASSSFEPEIDVTYFFTPNLAAELIAAVTTHHITDVGSNLGNVGLGHVTLLPPTLTAQYHFLPQAAFNPYIGAGINYTFFYNANNLPSSGAVNDISYRNNWGGALQAGFDYHLFGQWYANVDVKHVFLSTRVKINGGAITANVSLDPTIAGVGIGYKF